MKTHVITVLVLCLILLVGCQQSVDDLTVNEEYLISIEASIGDAGGSRYSGTTPNGAAFAYGDNIGLAYKVGEDAATDFVKWTFNGSVWTPVGTSMKWKNKTDNHNFYAFYPYNDSDVTPTLGLVKMPVLTGQDGTMVSVATRDFLVATKTQKYLNGDKVSFTGDDDAFKHVSSLVALTLNNTGDLVSAKINSISLKGTNLVAESNYSFTVDNVTYLEGESTSDDILSADFTNAIQMGDNETFYFVVNSGTINLDNVTLNITYTLEGEGKYTATKIGLKKPNGKHTQFQKGCMYNYGITITTDKVLTISNHSISNWGDGDSFDITIDNSQKQNQNS